MPAAPHDPRDPYAPDIAWDDRTTVEGPHPLVRAAVGLTCGLVAGAVAVLLTPRPDGAGGGAGSVRD